MYIYVMTSYNYIQMTGTVPEASNREILKMHNLEIVDGVAQMAFVGETPWHKLGKRVPADLTPVQMCQAAGLDWEVEKRIAYVEVNGKRSPSISGALVRKPNGKAITEERILTFLPNRDKWHELQNSEAFAFFNEFVMEGDMEMHTAGSLCDGELVWALARIKESFHVVKRRDEVQSYLLFTNPHRFGKAIDVRFTPTRVVCNNTLSLALSDKNAFKVSSSHRNPFDAETVKAQLGLAHYKLTEYKERAQFLAGKKYSPKEVVDYFKAIFPVGAQKKRADGTEPKRAPKEFHRGASYAMAIVDTQPGHDVAPGTWWNLYNAATFYTNHLAGKTDSSRVESLWYGDSAKTNVNALNLAVKGAEGKLEEGIKELLAAT